MSLAKGDKLGPYEILESIGKGGMGEVYRAHDPRTDRDVAIKTSAAQFTERFSREVRAIAALNHPNVCTLYDVGPNYLVMELVEGPTLAERIKEGAIPLEESLVIARQIADALEAAHEKGITHRDLKPGNVKIKPDGTVKVLDFGLAKIGPRTASGGEHDPEESPTISMAATQAGVILGTAAYMSPEQARGKNVDKRADIWAFGVVLYEMVTGKRLFQGEDLTETLASVVKEKPDFSEAPARVRRLLEKCLEKDPGKRLRDIGDWALLLDEERPAVPQASARLQTLWRISAGVAALFLLAFAAIAFVHFRETPPVPDTLRYQIPTPNGQAIQFPTLSPNGRVLAFVALSGNNIAIWIHELDQVESRPLPGTEGAAYPFWSPNSAYLGFFADGQLKKIAVGGGPATKLADAAEGRGGTWYSEGSQAGTILFSAGPKSPISRIPSSGGTPEPIIEPPDGSLGHRFPWFLPDGVHFLYNTLFGGDPEKSGMYIGSLDGDAPVRLLPDLSDGIYAPALGTDGIGYLLFLRQETTLMAQPFDPDSRQLTGEAFPIAEDIAGAGNDGFGAFTAAKGTLIYRTADASGGNRRLVWLDRTGKRLGEVGETGPIRSHALSPDGTKVALRRGSATQNEIWLQPLTAPTPSQLTFLSGVVRGMRWSPDGTSLAFSHNKLGVASLFRISPEGGKEELVLKGGANNALVDWSRDGKFLAYTEAGESTSSDIFLLPLDGERKPAPYLQTPAGEGGARFSPDGRWMAYVSNESGQQRVYVQDIPATGRKYQISPQIAGNPEWRRDGRELFFRTAGGWTAVPVTLGDTFQSGTPQALFDATGLGQIEPSADGQRFLVNVPAEETKNVQEPFTVVTNWQATLRP